MGYTDDDIANQEAKSSKRFAAVNAVLTENRRPPLFSDPSDTHLSALEYTNLLTKQTEEDLIAQFGCLWDEYVPKTI